jgi:hypothetical protein
MVYHSIHMGPLKWTALDVMHLEDAQVVNRRYALTGSRDSTVATIDLKDASDRIWNGDVEYVMPAWLTPLLSLARSTHCKVGAETVELGMYAGMGNATTFVVESLMFWAATQAMASLHGLHCAVNSVFGDDVVVDMMSLDYSRAAFHELGWVVNDKKSYWGLCPLRESCGIWAWNGQVVTPARFDGYNLGTPEGRSGFAAAIANLLDSRSGVALVCADRLMKVACPFIPVSPLKIPGSTVVFDKYGMWRDNHSKIRTRINKDTQLMEAKVEKTEAKTVEVPADRFGYLLGSLSGQIHTDVKRNKSGKIKAHVVRIPVPRRYTTRPRWTPCEDVSQRPRPSGPVERPEALHSFIQELCPGSDDVDG